MKRILMAAAAVLLFAGFVSAKEITVRPGATFYYHVPGNIWENGFVVSCREISVETSEEGAETCRVSLEKRIDKGLYHDDSSVWVAHVQKGGILAVAPGVSAKVIDFSADRLVLGISGKESVGVPADRTEDFLIFFTSFLIIFFFIILATYTYQLNN